MAQDWYNAPITQGFGPTDEPLDGPYGGYAHFNKGLDFGVNAGTPIGSPVSGTVVSAGDLGDGWGTSVKIRDANGFTHNFGHLSGVNVSPGQQIRAGEIVGASGNSGKSTGPHLSYDVWDADGKFIDPSRFVSNINDQGGKTMPTIDDFMRAISGQESGGNYDAVNPASGASGRFQIMPEYWSSWATEAGLGGDAPKTPENQDKVARFKMQQYFDKYGNWADVAATWYSGHPLGDDADAPQAGAPTIRQYTDQVMGRLGEPVNGRAPTAADIQPPVDYSKDPGWGGGPPGSPTVGDPAPVSSGAAGRKGTYLPAYEIQVSSDAATAEGNFRNALSVFEARHPGVTFDATNNRFVKAKAASGSTAIGGVDLPSADGGDTSGAETAAVDASDPYATRVQTAWALWHSAQSEYDFVSKLPNNSETIKQWGLAYGGPTEDPDPVATAKAAQDAKDKGEDRAYTQLTRTQDQADYAFKVSQRPSDEVSRQADEARKAADEYYQLLDKENGFKADEAQRISASANLADQAYKTALTAQKAAKNGDIWWTQAAVAPVWADPLWNLKPEQPKRKLSDMFYGAVPDYVLPDYRNNPASGLQGPTGFDDSDWFQYNKLPNGYLPTHAHGTDPWLPRFANGTPTEQQLRNLNSQERAAYDQTGVLPAYWAQQWGIAQPAATQSVPQGNTYGFTGGTTTYSNGKVPLNSLLPPDQQQYDQQAWTSRVVDDMLSNIESGRAGYPPGYDGPRWDQYVGTSRTAFPPGFVAGLTQWVRTHADNPGITDIWGAMPTQQTVYVDDPKAPKPADNTPHVYGTYAGSGQTSGLLGTGNGAPQAQPESGDTAAQISWEREKLEYQKTVDKFTQDLQTKQYESDAARQDAQLALQNAQLELQKMQQQEDEAFRQGTTAWSQAFQEKQLTQNETQFQQSLAQQIKAFDLQERQFAQSQSDSAADRQARLDAFKEQLRATAFQEGLSLDQYNAALQKTQFDENLATQQFAASQADAAWDKQFRQRDWDAQQAQIEKDNALKQAQFDWTKATDAEKFAYQKEQDALTRADQDKARQLQRAQTIAQLGANPGDAVQRQFYSIGSADPVGTARDVFTGQSTGQKTLGEVMTQDAPIYKQNQNQPLVAAHGTMGFTTAPQFLVGDDPDKKPKVTGYEEMIQLALTPDGKPAARVVSQKQLQDAKVLPKKGKTLGQVMA